MTKEEQLKRIVAFKCKDESRSISTVAVKDGVAYATDGKIVVSDRLDEDCEDVTDGHKKAFPIEAVLYFASQAEKAERWYAIGCDILKSLEDAFAEKFRSERILNDREYADRYKRVVCPSCGEDLWWDKWDDALVEDPEPKSSVEILDVQLPVRISFGNESMDVNFAYLFLLRKLFGDVLISRVYAERNHHYLLGFRTSDWRTRGVIMPFQDCHEIHIGGRIVQADEITE